MHPWRPSSLFIKDVAVAASAAGRPPTRPRRNRYQDDPGRPDVRFDWIVRGLGMVFLAPSLPLLLLVDAPTGGVLAFGSASVGIFLIVIVAERVVPAPSAQAFLDGTADALDSVRHGLALGGSLVYVPDQGNVGEERLFLAAAGKSRPVPTLDAQTMVYGGSGGTRRGVALVPPGLSLLQGRARPLEPGSRIEQMEAHVQGILGSADLATGVTVTPVPGGFEAGLHSGATQPPCMRDPTSPQCQRVGCHICQAIGCALVRAVGRPLVVGDTEVTPPLVRLLFQELEAAAGAAPPEETR